MEPSAFNLASDLLAHTLSCDDVLAKLSRKRTRLSGLTGLVHFLGHFVADEDIRARDPDYAMWQEGERRKMLMLSDGSGRCLRGSHSAR